MPIVTSDVLNSVKPDYIIVGGGTAGLTLAARLTEDPQILVLVLEAGTYHGPTPEIDIPGLAGTGITNPKFDWTFFTVPQKWANDQPKLVPRGKGLGGSSLLNFMAISRPSKLEVDALEELGNPGWNWDNLLPYFKKCEALQLPNVEPEVAQKYAAKPDLAYHGTDGPIKMSFAPVWADIHLQVARTAEALGIPANPDPGSGKNGGWITGLISVDAKTSMRSSAASGYLEPNLHRANLLVLPEAHVTKVILQSADGLQRAVGVELIKDGKSYRVDQVKRDVVIAAGAFQTPQILELSGIGNPAILSEHGIPTIVDLPGVGENLQDHVGVTTVVEIDTEDETIDVLSDPVYLKKHQELYKRQMGRLATNSANPFMFLPLDALGSEEEGRSWKAYARAQFTENLAKTSPSLRSGLEKQYRILEKLFDDKDQPVAEILNFGGRQQLPYVSVAEPGKRYTSLFCTQSLPLSRGTVHITSADPLAPPAIDPKYYSNDADLDLTTRAIEVALRLFKTDPLARHVKKLVVPSADVVAQGRAGLREYLRQNCGTVYHPVGTAAMMPRADGGVVDPTLKVYGTSNLRVVDLSILPLEPSSHTQSIAYAIGEKAADILKAEVARA